MEQILVECFVLVLGAGGQEDVATDIFVHDLAIGAQAGERNGDVLVKLDRHLEDEAQATLTSDKARGERSCGAGGGPELRTAGVADRWASPKTTEHPPLPRKASENMSLLSAPSCGVSFAAKRLSLV